MALELLTQKLGKKLIVNSGYRSPSYNALPSVRGAKNSMHTHGRAFDISVNSVGSDLKGFLKAAFEAGFVGFGLYARFVHIDTGTGRTWVKQGATMSQSALESYLRSIGWQAGMKGLVNIKGGLPVENNPNVNQKPIEQIKPSDLSKENDNNADSSKIGYKDPTNTFPLASYRGNSSTHKNAVGISDNTIQHYDVNKKEVSRSIGFSTGNGNSFGEPPIPYAAQYPHNFVYGSKSGHIMEFDDTPNSERINIQHKSGSFVEIDKNGTRVQKTLGDDYQFSERNFYHGVRGESNFSSVGTTNINTNANLNIGSDGDMKVTIGNDGNLQFAGHFQLKVAEDIKIKTKKIYIEADEIHILSNKDMFFQAKGNLNINAKSVLMNGSEGISMKTAVITQEASSGVSIKGGGKVNIGATNVNIKGSSTKIDGTSTTFINSGALRMAQGSATTTTALPPEGSAMRAESPANAIDSKLAMDTDLGDVSSLSRKTVNEVKYNSRELVRPSYKDSVNPNIQSSGTSDYVMDSNLAGYPNVSPNYDSNKSEEGHQEFSCVASTDSVNLHSPDGIAEYINQTYPRFKGGKKTTPPQEIVDSINNSCRKTGYNNGFMFQLISYEAAGWSASSSAGTTSAYGLTQMTNDAWTDSSKTASKYGVNLPEKSKSGAEEQVTATAFYHFQQLEGFENALRRKPTFGEMYIVHFMGLSGAINIIRNATNNTNRDEKIQGFESAKKSNRVEFYKANGELRTYKEFYDRQVGKFVLGNQTFTPNPPFKRTS